MEQQRPVIVSGKTLADFVAVTVSVATAATQFFKDEKSYEVLFLAVAFLFMYGYVKTLISRIDELKGLLDKLKLESDTSISNITMRYDRYVQVSNATIANLFSDVSAFAGERAIGSLTVDANSGAMVYIKAVSPTGPGGIERRGMPGAATGDPVKSTFYQTSQPERPP